MKRVLLTGVGGFIGAHCLKYFVNNTDWFIIGLDSFRHKGTCSRIIDISEYGRLHHPRVKILRHDLSVPIDSALENQIMDRRIDDRGNLVESKLDYVINLASDSAVERSVTDPSWCWRNNCELMLNMLEFARKVKPKIFWHTSTDEVYGDCPDGYSHPEWDVILPSNPYAASKAAQEALAISYWRSFDVPLVLGNIMNCHHEDTKAFTPNGSKHYHELKEGDDVFVLNNGQLVVEKIQKVIVKDFDGQMVSICHQKVEQQLTPNHRSLVQTRKHSGYSDLFYTEAKNLFGLSRFRIPLTGFWEGDSNFQISSLKYSNLHHNSKFMPEEIDLDKLLSLCGWFVSEGHLNKSISLAQMKPETRTKLKQLLIDCNLEFSETDRGFILYCKQLWNIFNEFGKTSYFKQIPTWVKTLSKDKLQTFFDAAMLGDGSKIRNKSGSFQNVYYTSCYKLAEDMCEIGLKLGFACRISQRYTWNPQKTKKTKSFVVRFRIAKCDVERKNLDKRHYKGKTWCLTVPSGNFAIIHKGVISFSGNCIGTGQDKEKFLPKLIWKIATNQEMEIYADPLPDGGHKIGSRYYLHVENHADAIKFCLGRPFAMYKEGAQRPDRYNVVGEIELNNLEMAQMIADIMGKELKYKLIPSESARRGYDRRYALDGSYLRGKGWQPPVGFREGLEKIVKWTLDHPWWLV